MKQSRYLNMESERLVSYLLLNQNGNEAYCRWCGIGLPYSDPHSLSYYLGIENNEEYTNFMLGIGWMKRHGSGLRVNKNIFETFITTNKMASLSIDYDYYRPFGSTKDLPYIRVGPKPSSSFTVADQYNNNSNPGRPKITFRKFLDETNSNTILSPSTEVTTTKKKTVTPEQDKLTAIPDYEDKSTLFNILGRHLLEKIFNPIVLQNIESHVRSSVSIEEILDSLATTTRLIQEEERRIRELRKEAKQKVTNQQTLTNINPSQYPFLCSKRIDPSDSHEIECLMRELNQLQKNSKDHDIFQFQAANSKPVSLVRIPRSSSLSNFQKNVNRDGYRFIDRILDAMIPIAGSTDA